MNAELPGFRRKLGSPFLVAFSGEAKKGMNMFMRLSGREYALAGAHRYAGALKPLLHPPTGNLKTIRRN